MKKVYVMLAQGFETIEALTPVDVLRRCSVDVKTVSIDGNKMVRSSQGVLVEADMLLSDADFKDADALVLPGGYPGYENLCACQKVGELAGYYEADPDKILAAICGGPTVLQTYKVGVNKNITCHASVVDQMTDFNYIGGNVVVDGHLITGAGAGLAQQFSIELAEHLVSQSTIDNMLKGMQIV